jgi:hypothetical protein
MSLNTAGQPLDPFKLLSESVSPVYLSLLLINIPGVFCSLAQHFLMPFGMGGVISLVFALFISPIVGAIGISFVSRYLQQQTMDLAGAVSKALNKSGQLILGMLLYIVAVVIGYILLIIPGFYLSIIWIFFLYPIVLEDFSAIDGLKYSQKLVEGRWWKVFGSISVGTILFIPAIVSGIIYPTNTHFVDPGALISNLIALVHMPIYQLYIVKLYLRVKETSCSCSEPNSDKLRFCPLCGKQYKSELISKS